MDQKEKYNITSDVMFKPLEYMDIEELHTECKETWYNRSLCRINDCVVRLGIIEGEFHWHKHIKEDEFFYVIEGRLFIDVKGKETVVLKSQHAFSVPKGVLHRTRAPERTVILMVEGRSVTPTGD